MLICHHEGLDMLENCYTLFLYKKRLRLFSPFFSFIVLDVNTEKHSVDSMISEDENIITWDIVQAKFYLIHRRCLCQTVVNAYFVRVLIGFVALMTVIHTSLLCRLACLIPYLSSHHFLCKDWTSYSCVSLGKLIIARHSWSHGIVRDLFFLIQSFSFYVFLFYIDRKANC